MFERTTVGRDEASFYSMVELFLSIPIESQCCQSYGVCGAQFVTDVSFERYAKFYRRAVSAVSAE